ncbi:LGFP repeat-containing protein [Corynebacterium aquilae]|uniref:LGFP repeat-containing protein n=1 Tax=Corynebacterium aquilae DSM 44791 TaxID=1431546 RepID=A0A1L7CF16_9CORY|nr:hypothetical protein [Corynebacterium aquilae]APT84439.1 hypothetical protein CAQU_04445 [Corynebacterium aquilae DSM 44791]
MKKTALRIAAATTAVALSMGMAACSTDDVKDGADKVAAGASDAAKSGADAAKDGADKAGEAAKDGADKAGDAAKDAADKVKDGADKAADAAKDEADKLSAKLTKVTDAQGAEVEIPEAAKNEWEKYGAESGELGAITEVVERNGEDYVINFSSGDSIIYGKDTGAVLLKGMIADTWFKDGGFENPIGLPTAPEMTSTDGEGWTQQFQNGTITWTNAETGEWHAVVA